MKTRTRRRIAIARKLTLASGTTLALLVAFGEMAVVSARSGGRPEVGTYSLLYSFQCSPDGEYPEAGLVRDTSGNLYGTTYEGGQFGYGTVVEVTPSGTETVLHSFAGAPSDGENPSVASLALDPAGNLYGTTPSGGEFGAGVVFKWTATTGGEPILYNFTGGTDGGGPLGGLARDGAGNLYGTTQGGGTAGDGVVFKLTPSGAESVLHNFGQTPDDGKNPIGNLTRDSSGNLYGTTYRDTDPFVYGTVFEVSASGTETLLQSFDCNPFGHGCGGKLPAGTGLLLDKAGNLYGVTEVGGGYEDGIIFKVTPPSSYSVLLNFNGSGGREPYDGLAEDAAGNLYGTTYYGGSTTCGAEGCGVLFELTTTGEEMVLHNFLFSTADDGFFPLGGVVRDPEGNLYGTLSGGGASGCGAVFKFTP